MRAHRPPLDKTGMDDNGTSGPLRGRRIALLEAREADRLGAMLAARGAQTVSCPLVAIIDATDAASVIVWLRRFVEAPFDDLILLTGEGLDRLHAAAERSGIAPSFVAALGRTRKITRGPKPARPLRQLGLSPDLRAPQPTTDGIIALFAGEDLRGRRIGVQLYPGADDRLVVFLRQAGANADAVVPYEYAAAADNGKVRALIDEMATGLIDVIAFTSAPQVRRLFEAAGNLNREDALGEALGRTRVAAIGPVVAAELQRHGIAPAIMPTGPYVMKTLVSAIVTALSR